MIKKILNFFYNKLSIDYQEKKEKNITQCCHHNDIEIDDYLFQQIFDDNVAIFAGAGISTENKFVYPITFYEQIANELDLVDENLSFPDLMEKYVVQVDGRARLIKKIQERFDHLNSFGFTRWASTMFHRQLATLYPIKTIITTNWDLFFEEYCKAIPYVHEQDMVFWDDSKRNVLKIHGSINSYSSLVATSSDYKKAEINLHKGLLGSKLKTILSEKNIVFIGYSFSDADFKEIYQYVQNTLGNFSKQSYVVTPFEDEAEKFKELGFIPLVTDGAYFITLIKQKAIQEELLFNDSIYEDAKSLLDLMTDIHEDTCNTINTKNHPHIIYTLAYQDGMIDALERAVNFQKTGEYSNPCLLHDVAMSYKNSLDQKFEQEQDKHVTDILDIAYIEGYRHALYYLLLLEEDAEPSKFPPFYYFYGLGEIENYKKFKQALKKYPKKFKKEYKNAYDYTKIFPDGHDYHHPPFLF